MEEAGLPPGTINVVNGSGAVTGAALGQAHLISIALLLPAAAAPRARSWRRGTTPHACPFRTWAAKSANIVFDDADFERAVDGSLVNVLQ